MNCPHCKSELPPVYLAATCPACGKLLSGATEPLSGGEPVLQNQPMADALWLVLKFVGWTVVVVAGAGLLGVSVLYAGCVCSQHVH